MRIQPNFPRRIGQWAIGMLFFTVCTGVFAKSQAVLRFGVEPNYAPFESKNTEGKLVGFDIDLGNALCEKIQLQSQKVRCTWVENDFDSMIPALKAKKIDAILSSMAITAKRQEEIAFTDKIYSIPARMVAKAGAALLPTAASLKAKRVGVAQGTTQELYAKTHWQPSGVNVVSYQDQDLLLADLVAGRLDATLLDAVQASEGFLKHKTGRGFAFAGPPVEDAKIFGSGAGIGVRKMDTALAAAFNRAFAQIRADGTYDRLAKKYFDFDIYNMK